MHRVKSSQPCCVKQRRKNVVNRVSLLLHSEICFLPSRISRNTPVLSLDSMRSNTITVENYYWNLVEGEMWEMRWDTHFGGVGERRLEDRPVDQVARVRRVTRVTGGRLGVERVAGRDLVMMKETASQLDVLLLAMVSDRGHGHVLVEHRRAHGAFATTKGSRPVNTANVTPATYATHASTHSARFVTFLVLFVLHLTHETNGNGVKLIV